MKTKKDNFIYRNFKLGIEYIKNSKKYIWFSSALFLCLIIFGYLFPFLFTQEIINYIQQLIKQTQDLNGFELITFITNNNIWSSFSGLFLGAFFGIIPFSVIVLNGYVLGFVINKTVSVEGIFSLWKLFPHGIFEIPAIMISVGLGLKLGTFLFYEKNKTKGILALFIFLISSLFSLMILSLIISVFAGTSDPVILQNFYENLMKNYSFVFLISLIIISSISLCLFISLKIFSKKEKQSIMVNFKSNIINSIRVFIFIIIPLLIIAGIIEGTLIWIL
jgi:stage II sporulation protein M